MNTLIILGSGAAGAFVGWWTGVLLCPDLGDIGLHAIPWAFGGAVAGAVAGVGVSSALVA